jgi:peptide deformylase
MILPIVPFGSDVLRKECINIDKSYENLDSLIDNMFETMYAASGVGLAAPQINKSLRLFIIDTEPFEDEENTGSCRY